MTNGSTIPKNTNAFKRLFARSMTPKPSDEGCWAYDGQTLTVLLDRAPELKHRGGALQLDDKTLPDRILLVHGIDDDYYVYANHCACGGFRIDPVPGEEKIRCCTLMKATYTYAGDALSDHVEKGLTVYPVMREGSCLQIDLSSPTVMPKAPSA